MKNQFLGEHEGAAVAPHIDEPGKHPVGAGHDPQFFLACLPLQHRRGIDLLVAQEGKALAAADDDRGEQGQNLGLEVTLQLFALLLAQGAEVHQLYSLLFEPGHQIGIEMCIRDRSRPCGWSGPRNCCGRANQ